MSADKLPPLPKPAYFDRAMESSAFGCGSFFTAEQMTAYGISCRADLEAAATLALNAIKELRYSNSTHAADSISDKAIEALKKVGIQ